MRLPSVAAEGLGVVVSSGVETSIEPFASITPGEQ